MQRRLIALHYSTFPDVGGLEMASWELTAAANRTPGWQGILVTGTPSSSNDERFNRICIPEMAPDYPIKRDIFEAFRRGVKHPAIEVVAEDLKTKLAAILQPTDLLISFNCFSLPYNLPLTVALWKITQERHDFAHVTWSWDLAALEDEYPWALRSDWPWSLFWNACPGVIYAASTTTVANLQAQILGIDPLMIRVINGGVDPSRCLRLSSRIAEICKSRNLFEAFPLLYMPAKISSRKDIPRAIDVLAELRSQHRNAHLVVAGSLSPHDVLTSQKARSLLERISGYGLSDAVTILGSESSFEGKIDFRDSMSMMAVSDGLLFTSKQEGFLFPILEAGLHRIPIFAPALDAVVSWASHYSVTYPPSSSPSEISRLVGGAFNDPASRRKFLFRTEYTWDRVFARHFSEVR
jgi:glycosyltransferase involved in cell wall biosynthesis